MLTSRRIFIPVEAGYILPWTISTLLSDIEADAALNLRTFLLKANFQRPRGMSFLTSVFVLENHSA